MTDNDTPADPGEPGPHDDAPKPMPSYQPAPPLRGEALLQNSSPINLRVPLVDDLPPQQMRWTIAIRLLLLIPQVIVLFFVLVGAYFVTIVAWFCALFTGRVPEGLASYQRLTVRWSARVDAYTYLMVDLYPPFHGDEDTDYPIGIEFPEALPLNRLAVLFRIIIMIPAYAMGGFIQVGFVVFLIPYWIAALILGRLPDPVYRAAATIVRFQSRLFAYIFMLTPEYPWGWKGDQVGDTWQGAASSATDATSEYWGAVANTTAVVMPQESSRFNFQLTGWALTWIWIYLVIGVLEEVITRR